ncbi:MAG: RpiB/LacA/LacB family sugar-phosphate isomerase, partial [Oscillospiraceae bacterium]|nr:RpiB/LacA/LacB family sugar-phosphate isomerase [Oscillospiraceae bacterium]
MSGVKACSENNAVGAEKTLQDPCVIARTGPSRIGFACDHAGFALKETLMAHVRGRGLEAVDYGAFGKERVDYNEFGESACRGVRSGETDAAVLVCGTGMGMSITA